MKQWIASIVCWFTGRSVDIWRVTTTHNSCTGEGLTVEQQYCGTDRAAAHLAYYKHAQRSPTVSIKLEIIKDAGTSVFADDLIQKSR